MNIPLRCGCNFFKWMCTNSKLPQSIRVQIIFAHHMYVQSFHCHHISPRRSTHMESTGAISILNILEQKDILRCFFHGGMFTVNLVCWCALRDYNMNMFLAHYDKCPEYWVEPKKLYQMRQFITMVWYYHILMTFQIITFFNKDTICFGLFHCNR